MLPKSPIPVVHPPSCTLSLPSPSSLALLQSSPAPCSLHIITAQSVLPSFLSQLSAFNWPSHRNCCQPPFPLPSPPLSLLLVNPGGREMKTGDSLSPCLVAMWRRHGAVRCRWWGIKICSTHEREAGNTRDKRRSRRGTKCRHHQCTPFGKLIDAKNWKAERGSWVPAKSSCAKCVNRCLILNHYLILTVAFCSFAFGKCKCFAFSSPHSKTTQAHEISIYL